MSIGGWLGHWILHQGYEAQRRVDEERERLRERLAHTCDDPDCPVSEPDSAS